MIFTEKLLYISRNEFKSLLQHPLCFLLPKQEDASAKDRSVPEEKKNSLD